MITGLSVYCVACTEHAILSQGCLNTMLHVLSMLCDRRIVRILYCMYWACYVIAGLSVYCVACTEHAMRSHGCLYTVLHVLSML